MQAVVIANPVAGPQRGRLSGDEACALLRARGHRTDLQITTHSGHATEIARQAAGSADVVVAVGGDGTVHETATGLVGTGCPLAVLPSGSGNDFAVGNGLTNVEAGLAGLDAGTLVEIDVGRLDDMPFFNSVGLLGNGLVSATAAKLWRWLGRHRYTLAGAWHVVRSHGQEVQWFPPGTTEPVIEDTFMLAEICNGPLTGGGFRFAPDARFDDGVLDICLARRVSVIEGLAILPKAAAGRIIEHPAFTVLRAASMGFSSESPVAYHRDGEYGTLAPGMHTVAIGDAKLLLYRPRA